MEWFVELNRPSQVRATIFCFHFGGGSSHAFRPWLEHLPVGVKLVGVDLPGRAARFGEELLTDVNRVIDGLLKERAFLLRHTPRVFFGHSLGAMVAFELARHCPPRHIFVSGRRAPHEPLPRTPIYDLPDRDFLEALARYGGTPDEVLRDAELMELFLPVLKADFALSESYRFVPTRPLTVPLTVMGGTDDEMTDCSALDAWSEHTVGPFAVRRFRGGHFFLREHGAEIVRHLVAAANVEQESWSSQ